MSIPLGLSAGDQAKFNAQLWESHSIQVTVQVLDLNHNRLADLSDRLLDGQVNIDATSEVTRSCTVSLLDPARSLHLDSDSPNAGALYADRMIQVNYSVKVISLGRWVTVPLFTGPIVKLDRTDDVVNIEAQGKESLALNAAWTPQVYKKGSRKVDAIWAILRRTGELTTKLSIPEWPNRLAADFNVTRETSSWKAAQQVAYSLSAQLFYDGRGVARLRPYPKTPTFGFATGVSGSVMSQPQVSFNLAEVKNTIWVIGNTNVGGGRAQVNTRPFVPAWVAMPQTTHPLSPQRLGRQGANRHLLEVVHNDSITTQAEARAVATDLLEQRLLQAIEVSFDSLPVPHLDPYDIAILRTSEFSNGFRVKQMSIPLTVGANMSVGYLNRVALKKRLANRRGKR